MRSPQRRRLLSDDALSGAQKVIDLAWEDLPPEHRRLLQNVAADQRKAADSPLGGYADDLLRSAGHPRLPASVRNALDGALGVWIRPLNLVLIDAGHPQYVGLDDQCYEAVLARVAWHEWAHALGVARCTHDDVAAGRRLLALAPDGVRNGIRQAGYRPSEYTHELVAEVYALLMARRRRGQLGRPPWLDSEIYHLMRRVCGWNH